MTTTTDPPAQDSVLRRRLIQAVGALREAVATIDNSGKDPWRLLAQVRAVLVDALTGKELLEPVRCDRGHGWWRLGGESAACPECRAERLEAAVRGEILPGVWPLDLP